MPYSQAALGYLSAFYTGDNASPISYTAVTETAEINFAGFTVPEVDVTHLQSPGAVMESIPGFIKPGTIEITGNFIDDTSQRAFTTLGLARTIFNWKIDAPKSDGSTFTITGKGFVSKLQKGPFSATAKQSFSASIQVTGLYTESRSA
jgi:hypothetical protein